MSDTKDSKANQKPEPVFYYRITVPESAIDQNGHVNNVAYVQWMQDVAIAHSTSTGGTDAAVQAGGTWVARSHHVEYLNPAFLGEEIEVQTAIINMRRVRSVRRYRFTRLADNTVLARGETDWVFLNLHTGRPGSVPATVQQCFTLAPDFS